MNVVRLAISAGTLTLAVSGGLTALGGTAAQAADCTGLIRCTTRDVGDTVDHLGKVDLPGTVDRAGRTVGDTVDGVRRTVDGGRGDTGAGAPGTPPVTGNGRAGAPSGGGRARHPSTGSPGTTQEQRPHRTRSTSPAADPARGTGSAGDSASMWVSLRQWNEPGLPVTGLRPRTSHVDGGPVEAPLVAPLERARGTEIGTTRAAAVSRQAPPAGPVFLATTLAGTVGLAVLSVYPRRRRGRHE